MASTGEVWRRALAALALIAATFGVVASSAEEQIPATALDATEPSEIGVVQEPSVWHDGHRWNMVYTGGWAGSSLGWATADRARGPWVKRGIILGNGVGGWDGPVSHASVLVEGGKHFVYFPDQIDGDGSHIRVAVGHDLRDLHVRAGVALSPPAGALGPANTSVIKDGDQYRMLYDAKVDRASWWEMGYATADSPVGPFRTVAFPLPSLQRHPDSMYGGADLRKTRRGYAIWYHAARDGNTTLPTDLYRATSTDLIHWVADSQPTWVHPSGYDQYADPVRVRRGERAWLFFSLMNNPAPSGRIVVTRLR